MGIWTRTEGGGKAMTDLREALAEYVASRPQPPGKLSFEEDRITGAGGSDLQPQGISFRSAPVSE